MKLILLLSFILGLAGLRHAHAVVLIGWDPDGLSGTWPENWSSSTQGGTVTVDSGIEIVTGLSRGAGTNPGTLNDGWGATGIDQTTQATAISGNDYLSFSLGPQEGNMMSLTSLDFNLRMPATGWNTGNTRYLWQYKVGDGTFVDIGSALSLVGAYNTAGVAQPSLDLSGIAALQNTTADVEFRVYAWGSSGGQFVFGRLEGNDLSLSGSVSAVPEPSRALFLVLGTSVWMLRRQRYLSFMGEA